jgi:hypothetical protein
MTPSARLGLALLLALSSVPASHGAAGPNTLTAAEKAAGWKLLFDGRSLTGWRASEAPATFSVQDGCIVAFGPRAHLFYEGPVAGARFRNFELQLEVKTFPKGNSGVYLHTEYQEKGWPSKGYEVQVNQTHSDKRKTGGIYAIKDNLDPVAQDEVWFTLRILVEGKRIRSFVDGKLIADYTEEPQPVRPPNMAGRLLGEGTIALQGHDPESRVMYRGIKIRPLP